MESEARLAREVHRLVRDLMVTRRSIYWLDFGVSWSSSVIGLAMLVLGSGWIAGAGLVVASFALYRLSVFTHEIAHFRPGQFTAFVVVWNTLAGIPCLLPSFLYGDHRVHHVNHSYGTESDAEYYPLAHGPIWAVIGYFSQVLFLPIAAVFRFLVLTPIGLLHPSIRRVIWERFSGMLVINPLYRRAAPRPRERAEIWLSEAACFVWLVGWAVGLLAGMIPWMVLAKLYGVFVLATSVNFFRALGSHRYTNTGGEMRYVDQLLDSTTVEGLPLVTGLVAPLGMRYHALHHLVPSLPYHSLGQAHRRLVANLPTDSPYHQTIYPSLWAAVWEVCRGAWQRGPVPRTGVSPPRDFRGAAGSASESLRKSS